MEHLERGLRILCCAVLLFILGTVAWHVRGWSHGIDNLQDKAQRAAGSLAEAADTSNLVSTETLNLIGSANLTIDRINGKNGKPGLLDRFNVTLNQADTVFASADVTVKQIGVTFKDIDAKGVESLQKWDEATRSADLALKEILPLLRATTASVQTVGQAAESANQTLQASHAVIAGPLMTTAHNVEAMSGDTREAVHRMTRPAKWFQVVGEKLLGLAANFAQIVK